MHGTLRLIVGIVLLVAVAYAALWGLRLAGYGYLLAGLVGAASVTRILTLVRGEADLSASA